MVLPTDVNVKAASYSKKRRLSPSVRGCCRKKMSSKDNFADRLTKPRILSFGYYNTTFSASQQVSRLRGKTEGRVRIKDASVKEGRGEHPAYSGSFTFLLPKCQDSSQGALVQMSER